MKIFFLRPAVLIFLTAMFVFPSVCVGAESLYLRFKNYPVVSVLVSDPVNQSQNEKVKAAGLKQAIEKAFLERKSTRFQIASASENADILIETAVTEYY